MVIIDSSESSSDEEDRRLRPIPRLNCNWGSSIRIYDALEKPEGYTAPENWDLENKQNFDILPILCQNKEPTLNIGSSQIGNISQVPEGFDITREMTYHTRSLEGFVEKIEQIPLQTSALSKLRIGLKLINEFLCAVESSDSAKIQANENLKSAGSFYSDSSDNVDCTEDWHNCFDSKNVYTLMPDVLMETDGASDNQSKKDAGSQTNIIGEIIPREATAALEFFQELIKHS